MQMRKIFGFLVAVGFMAGLSSTADAATITCPIGGSGDTLTVTYTATSAACVDSGTHPADHFPTGSDTPISYNGTDYDYIGECTGAGADCTMTATTWSIADAPGDFLVLWKFGSAQGGPSPSPNWFLLFFDDLAAGTYNWNSTVTTGLSHIAVWGGETSEEPPPVVPEPASLLLLGTGLLGAAAIRRRTTRR